MADDLPGEPETTLARQIAQTLTGQPFDVALTALEFVMAAYLAAATDDPVAQRVGAGIIARHLPELCRLSHLLPLVHVRPPGGP